MRSVPCDMDHALPMGCRVTDATCSAFFPASHMQQTDGMVLTVGACVVSFVAILVGHKLKLDTSARLYIITFLLVIFGADRGSGE